MAYFHAQAGQADLARTRGSTVPTGPLLLTGYSQGRSSRPPSSPSCPRRSCLVALLTLACPARRLYGRAFPAYFGAAQLAALARLLDASTTPDQPPKPGPPHRWDPGAGQQGPGSANGGR